MRRKAARCAARGHDIDLNVSRRMRERRVLLGLTQPQVAELLGIAYQQVHKYETGVNRISVGRLHQVAQVLGVEVGYFFEDLDPAVPAPQQRRMLELMRHFTGLPRAHQEALCELARAFAYSAER